MFDRIFDAIHTFFSWFQCWAIIDEYERGVVKTLGKRRRENPVLEPGLHWVWPFGVDEVLVENVVPTTIEPDIQSLTTLDGKSICVNVVITWAISDVEKYLFDVESPEDAFEDVVCGLIGEVVVSSNWADIHNAKFVKNMTTSVRRRMHKWGIKVVSLRIKNLSVSRTIRLLQ